MSTTRVRVSEQNPADATFGFGVVFSDQALDFLQADDPETHALITPLMECWRNMTPSLEFAFTYLTRSGRVDMQRLRGVSPRFLADYEVYLAAAKNR